MEKRWIVGRRVKTSTCSPVGFVEYIRERQAATDRRRAGQPQPWSDDPVIATKKLCSVIRDDDRTSVEAKGYILSLPPEDALRAASGSGF